MMRKIKALLPLRLLPNNNIFTTVASLIVACYGKEREKNEPMKGKKKKKKKEQSKRC